MNFANPTSTAPRGHSQNFNTLRLLGLAGFLASSLAVQAATMTLDISGNLPSTHVNNYFQHNGSQAGLQWVPEAQAYFAGLTLNSPFEVHFTYDPAAAVASQPLNLVSGKIGNVTDFTGWTTQSTFTENGAGIETWIISMQKRVFEFPDRTRPGRDQYISAYFTARFADPGFINGVATLPANPFALGNLTNLVAEFRYHGQDAGSLEYASWFSSNFTGFTGALRQESTTPPDVPGVPDSGATLFLLGTAMVLLPAARRVLPARAL
jgi:hypothetical protein